MTFVDTWAQTMRGGANICPQGAVAIHAILRARDTAVAIATASALKFTDAGVAYHAKNMGKFSNPYKIFSAAKAKFVDFAP